MPRRPTRRRFLTTLATTATAVALPRGLRAADAALRTYTFKTAGDCAIQADVFGGAADGPPRPVVVWIHGGALIMGHRGGIDARFRDDLVMAGCVVVSIDYRLAPETKLPAILQDVRDACRWVRERGPGLFRADPARLAVTGGSAGGYLTLTTGYRVEPRPTALVAYWGYGDVAADWYSKPDPFYLKQPPVSRAEALGSVGTSPLSGSPGQNNRPRFYLYCRQQGLWPREVAGLDPERQREAFRPFCPAHNVTAQFPPTLLIHGTKDTDVPYEQSVQMEKELARHHVEHELLTVEGAGHGLLGADPATRARVHERVLAFLRQRLRPEPARE